MLPCSSSDSQAYINNVVQTTALDIRCAEISNNLAMDFDRSFLFNFFYIIIPQAKTTLPETLSCFSTTLMVLNSAHIAIHEK